MFSIITDKLLGLWDYCVENKKQSIIIAIALFLAFMVFGYFSILIVAKVLSFAFSLVISLLSFYLSNLLFTLPLTLLGVWWYKSRG